ncbi:hypothetical protein [Nonomuraea lactucae]|uniref:hypothetical protein n=1 Tax=Nonomuraea lactucae TaxID=2249762 RepID=UPI0013B3F4FA|nr:hypothetical protein [Nonomuraea lactucae]
MPKNVPFLGVFGAVRDASGRLLAVVEVLLPADRHEPEHAYPISRGTTTTCPSSS